MLNSSLEYVIKIKISRTDYEIHNAYLCKLQKVLENVVAHQIRKHLENNLHEEFQSAYKKHYNTETALLLIQNDIFTTLDKQKTILLILLDLSAGFGAIDRSIILSRFIVRLVSLVISWHG